MKTNLKKEDNIRTKKQKKLKVSLKHDLTFKNFFKNNKKALKSLLENFLPLPAGKNIQTVEVLDSAMPILEKMSAKTKNPIMDLRLKLDTGELVNVEMQMCPHPQGGLQGERLFSTHTMLSSKSPIHFYN